MESNRQKKIAGVIQRDLADILQRAATDGGLQGILISVTKVSVTVDLSIAKVYLSIFPNAKSEELIGGIQNNKSQIKHELARRTRNQLRRVPELEFFVDDSLEYIDKIEKSLKGSENPIENPDMLNKRKKS
ncbi:30S ribosome-binding factor RbfA [Sinomicrobium pectinilyticum]|uniref:Ribosome-binding factor A n=1 Tax=Sinomicrobium pectinilyticum TaxID=1084421 RepID=A0A3N0E618_SINP1|nr:30S ribosome-binding factor RbfA [Sinomicrobium pectinilyticum]RNL83276.1 30S ribosome-binding factor RbfA [Sinomicrobium pectinilyticum]